ncbi:hypothetical protein BGZ51_001786, partial [Haplosporangium sp. Z 767]
FKHQDIGYYQVLPVGKEDYNTLQDIVLQGHKNKEDGTQEESDSPGYYRQAFTRWDPRTPQQEVQHRTMELYGISPLVNTNLLDLALAKFGKVEKKSAMRPAARGMQMTRRVTYETEISIKVMKERGLQYIHVGRDLVRIGSLGGERL